MLMFSIRHMAGVGAEEQSIKWILYYMECSLYSAVSGQILSDRGLL